MRTLMSRRLRQLHVLCEVVPDLLCTPDLNHRLGPFTPLDSFNVESPSSKLFWSPPSSGVRSPSDYPYRWTFLCGGLRLHFVIFVSSLRLLCVSYIPASVSVVSARVATFLGLRHVIPPQGRRPTSTCTLLWLGEGELQLFCFDWDGC
jgi:hypothetical protein